MTYNVRISGRHCIYLAWDNDAVTGATGGRPVAVKKQKSEIRCKSLDIFSYTLKTKVSNQHFKEFGQWLLIIKLDLTFKSVELTLIKLDLTPC